MTAAALRPVVSLVRSETTKFVTARASWVLAGVTICGTWLMAWVNAASGVGIPADDPRLFSAEAVPLEYWGFEMAGFGYVLVVALAALWAGSEYGPGRQIRTTLLATPQRVRVFVVKSSLLAVAVALVSFLTMAGAIAITHAGGGSALHPLLLTPPIWAHIGGATLAWTLTALIAFAVGVLARSAILPIILLVPLVIGIGDLLIGLWAPARYLPVAAGATLYSDPAATELLDPATGGIVHAAWAVVLLGAAATAFTTRDL